AGPRLRGGSVSGTDATGPEPLPVLAVVAIPQACLGDAPSGPGGSAVRLAAGVVRGPGRRGGRDRRRREPGGYGLPGAGLPPAPRARPALRGPELARGRAVRARAAAVLPAPAP